MLQDVLIEEISTFATFEGTFWRKFWMCGGAPSRWRATTEEWQTQKWTLFLNKSSWSQMKEVYWETSKLMKLVKSLSDDFDVSNGLETPEFLPWWSCDLKRHKGAVLIQELWRGRLRARVRSLENIFPLLLLPLLFVVWPGVVERKEAVCICYFGSVNLVHFFCLHFSLFQKIMAIYRVIPLIFLHSLRYICWFRAVLF